MKAKRKPRSNRVASDDVLCVTLTKKRLKEMLDSAYISGAQDERAAIARKRDYA
jgi:hypothetical protein